MDKFNAQLTKKNILVADGFSPGRLVLSEVLNIFGYNHKTVSGAKELILHLNTCETDLVLLDLNLRGFDGFEVIEHIRRNLNYPRNIVPVVAMADEHFAENLDLTYDREGFAAVIRKPFSLDELDYTLHSILYPQQTFASARSF